MSLTYWLAALFLFWSASCRAHNPAALSVSAAVELRPIALDPQDPGRREVGSVILMSAFQLRSTDPRFGGLSGLSVDTDGKFYAISDRGYWITGRMAHDRAGRLTDIAGWEIRPLLAEKGKPVKRHLTDAEGLARDREGSFIVSFEQVHRIWRYPLPPATFGSRPQPLPSPPELGNAPKNRGAEGITVIPDGRILVIAEDYPNRDGSMKGWLMDRGKFESISYPVTEGFRVSDLAALPDGDVLVLERRLSLIIAWAARIRRIPRSALRAGATIEAKEIVRLEPPFAVGDNFEAMAITNDNRFGTFIYLLSDDNFSPFQRTLLLQFLLPPGSKK